MNYRVYIAGKQICIMIDVSEKDTEYAENLSLQNKSSSVYHFLLIFMDAFVCIVYMFVWRMYVFEYLCAACFFVLFCFFLVTWYNFLANNKFVKV